MSGSDDELEETVAGLAVTSSGTGSSQQQLSTAVDADGRCVTSSDQQPVWPCARMNAQLAVQSGLLYLYGGMYEDDDKQVTLQDMYARDLHKLDEWRTIIRNKADQLVSSPTTSIIDDLL